MRPELTDGVVTLAGQIDHEHDEDSEELVAPFNPFEEIEASIRVVTLERRSQAASFNCLL
jgi:hypothetical protein